VAGMEVAGVACAPVGAVGAGKPVGVEFVAAAGAGFVASGRAVAGGAEATGAGERLPLSANATMMTKPNANTPPPTPNPIHKACWFLAVGGAGFAGRPLCGAAPKPCCA
jgi:hypothetical protein